MPTPIEIMLDPTSLIILLLFSLLLLIQNFLPGRALPKVKGWLIRASIMFALYFFLSAYLPLFWDSYLSQYQLLDLSDLNPFLSAFLALLVFELLIYVWHRTMHQSNWLWHLFHQMHHSAERVDLLGAFYFSPLDMIGFTLLSSLSLVVIVGVSPEAASYFLYISLFLAMFQHSNLKTPQWLGYIIQRPESHSLHHARGVHRYNYSDLPIYDLLFGTFKNPKHFQKSAGFYDGASKRIPEMLVFKNVSKSR